MLKLKDKQNRIFLINGIDYIKMLRVMKEMDIGVLPYLPIGNHLVTRPNKLFEYMLASLPVIASKFPLYKEVIDQGVGVCVDPTQISELKLAIEELASNRDLRRNMG